MHARGIMSRLPLSGPYAALIVGVAKRAQRSAISGVGWLSANQANGPANQANRCESAHRDRRGNNPPAQSVVQHVVPSSLAHVGPSLLAAHGHSCAALLVAHAIKSPLRTRMPRVEPLGLRPSSSLALMAL